MGYQIGLTKYHQYKKNDLFFGIEYLSLRTSNTFNPKFYRGNPNAVSFYTKTNYDYFTFGGRRMGAHSGSSSDDIIFLAGFKNIKLTDRNKWYLNLAKKELNDLSTIYKEKLIKILGIEDAEGTINIWKKMIEVLEKGEHRPGHFYAEKQT